MCSLFNLTNHTMTREQLDDAAVSLGVMEEVLPPEEIRTLWGNVPPELDSVKDYIFPVLYWLSSHLEPTDIVWVQGEWGSTLAVVEWCRARGVKCVYATTNRVAQEIHTDKGVQMMHTFKHVRFRDYFVLKSRFPKAC